MKKFLLLVGVFFTFSLAANASPISGTQKMNLNTASTLMGAGAVAIMRNIEQEANSALSNMDGDDDDYDSYDSYGGYTGINDDFLDFGGQPSSSGLLSAVAGFNYTFTLVNAKAAARTVYLFPSSKNKTASGANVAGTMTEGVFAAIDDVAETNITATGDSYGTVDFLRRFVENNPTFVQAFQIQSSTAAGIQQGKVVIEEVSPFGQLQARTLKPSMEQDQGTFNDKIIVYKGGFDMNDQCCVKITIAAQTSLSITIVCGAILNKAKALQNKRYKAVRFGGGRRRK